jgi:hypothetical protein
MNFSPETQIADFRHIKAWKLCSDKLITAGSGLPNEVSRGVAGVGAGGREVA